MFTFTEIALAPKGTKKLQAKTATSRLPYNNGIAIDPNLLQNTIMIKREVKLKHQLLIA